MLRRAAVGAGPARRWHGARGTWWQRSQHGGGGAGGRPASRDSAPPRTPGDPSALPRERPQEGAALEGRGRGLVVERARGVGQARPCGRERDRSGLSGLREGAAAVAHVCEALANARPSPFLPLFAPRKPRPTVGRGADTGAGGAKAEGGQADGASVPKPKPSVPPRSFFRRPLPARLIPFNSAEGKRILKDVLADGECSGGGAFFEIMGAFEMQKDPVSCGLASLGIALNALDLAPWRPQEQRGVRTAPVREDEILRALVPPELQVSFMKEGSSLEELSRVARNVEGLEIKILSGDEEDSVTRFRQELDAATRGGVSLRVLILNFSRPDLGQTGTGHFSPVAAYDRKSDMALVLDTARFKYPAFWVPVPELWRSCMSVDKDTGRARGSISLWKAQ